MTIKPIILKKVWFIVVANQPYFGGGIKIAPEARFDDEEFNILVVHNISPIKLLSVFITVSWGGHLRIKNVDSFSAHGVQITSKQPVKIQADGEFIGVSHVEVKMSAEKISVLSKVNNQALQKIKT